MIEKSYTIDNIINFKIFSQKKVSNRMLIEYKNFECNCIEDPDFRVYLGDFIPTNQGCTIIDNIYHIKENYFYCAESYKHGSWKLEISGLDSGPLIIKLSTNLIGSWFADMFICTYIIDFLIRYKLNSKGFSIVHASAISNGDHAFLFPSQSGAGKTTTALYFAEEGHSFLGDDFVIIHKGKVLSYLTPLNIFSYNLNHVILGKLNSVEKLLLYLKDLIHKLTSGNIKIFTKANPVDLFPDQIVTDSRLSKVFLLAPGNKFYLEGASRNEILNSLFINIKIESFPFLKYLMEYAYVFPESDVAKFWDVCLDNLNKNIDNSVELYKMNVPKKYDRMTFKMVKEAVLCGT